MSYTKGPWKYSVNVGPTRGLIVECNGSTVVELRIGVRDSRFEDNARLIAAAPELLKACERVLSMWEWCISEGGADGPLAPHLIKELASMQNEICEQIQAAIEKAKGTND